MVDREMKAMQVRIVEVGRPLHRFEARCVECDAAVHNFNLGDHVDTEDLDCAACEEAEDRGFDACQARKNEQLQAEWDAVRAAEWVREMKEAAKTFMTIRTKGMGCQATIKFRSNCRHHELRGKEFTAWGETPRIARNKVFASFVADLG